MRRDAVRRCTIVLAMIWLGLASGLISVRADDTVRLGVVAPGADAAGFTIDQLGALGETKLATTTPWSEGRQDFVGITGAQFVAALEAQGQKLDAKSVLAVANNDYSIVIPFDVFAQPTTLIAFSRNGAAMPVRDKGPFWIVFPYDTDAKFLSSSYKAYSIWGLQRLEFQPE